MNGRPKTTTRTSDLIDRSLSESGLRVLVTGATGQLGRAILQRLANADGVTALGLTRKQADFAGPALRDALLSQRPDVVINAAAITAVDRAETERALTMRVNAEAVRELALLCEATGARLVQISTDYVFDGSASEPYPEAATPRPVSWYGISKLAGEHAALAYAPQQALVVRTSAIFAAHQGSDNFVATMLRLAGHGRELRVVTDQTTAPTYAPHLADALWRLLQAQPTLTGTVHLTAQGATTWYDFARAIFAEAQQTAKLEPTTSAEHAAPAKRPAYSLLANETLARLRLEPLPPWQEGLQAYLAAVNEKHV